MRESSCTTKQHLRKSRQASIACTDSLGNTKKSKALSRSEVRCAGSLFTKLQQLITIANQPDHLSISIYFFLSSQP
jgi:hypothetical protein